MPLKLLTTHTTSLNGRTLRLTVNSTSVYEEGKKLTDISETIQINKFVKVRVKVECDKWPTHFFFLSTVVHELAKDATFMVNVSCDELKYADKWTCCSGKWTEWIDIGNKDGYRVEYHMHVLLTEISISVNKITTTLCECPKLYADSDMTDFTLSTQDGNVDVHRAFLAVRSPVFKTMFTGTWKETKENLIVIKGYTRKTVQQLKEFLYLGTLPDDVDEMRSLITLAALYSIKDLKEECVKKLAETVQPEDLYSLHELACENNIPELSFALSHLTLEEVICRAREIKEMDNNQEQTENQ